AREVRARRGAVKPVRVFAIAFAPLRARARAAARNRVATARAKGTRGRRARKGAVGSAHYDARVPRPRDRSIDSAVAGGFSLSEAARPPAWRPSRCSERSGSRALPPFHVRRASPLFALLPSPERKARRITLDHPASHRLNSGSDWPSSRCGEASLGAVGYGLD